MSAHPECPKCGAFFDQWYVLDRAHPGDVSRGIDLGKRDPGANWWAMVKAWWDVSDRPTPGCWHPPQRARPTPGGCTLCAPAPVGRVDQPALFDPEPEPESGAA